MNFKRASQLKLRFNSSKGQVSAEQLWDLTLSQLKEMVVEAKAALKSTVDSDLDFLTSVNTVDEKDQLTFDILKDVYMTKKAAQDEAKVAAANKEENQKIMAIIAQKQDQSLQNMSVEDLQKMLK